MKKLIVTEDKGKKAMNKLIPLFRKNNIPFFLMGGTLIGAVRENRFLPYDKDIDIGVLEEHWKPKFKKELSKVFEIYSIKKYDKTYSKYINKESECIVKVVDEPDPKYKRTRIGIHIHTKGKDGRYFIRYKGELVFTPEEFMKFKSYKFYDWDVLIPEDYDAYLTYFYGDWKTPDKNYIGSNKHKENIKRWLRV